MDVGWLLAWWDRDGSRCQARLRKVGDCWRALQHATYEAAGEGRAGVETKTMRLVPAFLLALDSSLLVRAGSWSADLIVLVSVSVKGIGSIALAYWQHISRREMRTYPDTFVLDDAIRRRCW